MLRRTSELTPEPVVGLLEQPQDHPGNLRGHRAVELYREVAADVASELALDPSLAAEPVEFRAQGVNLRTASAQPGLPLPAGALEQSLLIEQVPGDLAGRGHPWIDLQRAVNVLPGLVEIAAAQENGRQEQVEWRFLRRKLHGPLEALAGVVERPDEKSCWPRVARAAPRFLRDGSKPGSRARASSNFAAASAARPVAKKRRALLIRLDGCRRLRNGRGNREAPWE